MSHAVPGNAVHVEMHVACACACACACAYWRDCLVFMWPFLRRFFSLCLFIFIRLFFLVLVFHTSPKSSSRSCRDVMDIVVALAAWASTELAVHSGTYAPSAAITDDGNMHDDDDDDGGGGGATIVIVVLNPRASPNAALLCFTMPPDRPASRLAALITTWFILLTATTRSNSRNLHLKGKLSGSLVCKPISKHLARDPEHFETIFPSRHSRLLS